MRLAFALALATLLPAGASAQSGIGGCELHVWGGGYPNRVIKGNAFIKIVPEARAPDDPLSNKHMYNSVNRARALSDDALRKLLPDASSVTIVRHDDMLDMDAKPIKSITKPLAAPSGDCYADLVIANLYAIFPNPGASYTTFGLVGGMLADTIAGSDRLVIDFWFQRYGSGRTKPFVFRKKNDSPLPHVAPNTPDIVAALAVSGDYNLGQFADAMAKKTKS